MKKKLLMKMAFAVLLVAALASCKKDAVEQFPASNNSVQDSEILSSVEGMRGLPYGPTLADIEALYDCCFDFTNIMQPVSPSGMNLPYMWVVPSTWLDDTFLTIMIDNGANIEALYIIQFTTNVGLEVMDNLSPLTQSSMFTICNMDDANYMFYGLVALNVPNTSDFVQIYNGINIPAYYPYHIFDNISVGYVNLENYSLNGSGFGVPPAIYTYAQIALRIASTFYIHFNGTN